MRTTRVTTHHRHDLRPPARAAGPGAVRIGVSWFVLAALGWVAVAVGAVGAFGLWAGLLVAGGLLVVLSWGSVALFVAVATATARRMAVPAEESDER